MSSLCKLIARKTIKRSLLSVYLDIEGASYSKLRSGNNYIYFERLCRCRNGSSLVEQSREFSSSTVKQLQYVQGWSPDGNNKIREYFYYIDHQGQLFLDDARIKNFTSCFKEKDFLVFFFKRLKVNDGGKYADEFPYISPCGREKNYVRCDDTPVVFTHVIDSFHGEPDKLSYGYSGDRMTVNFEPEHICMLPKTGRVYHPCPQQYGGLGLVKSALAIELSKFFRFDSGDETSPPSHFTWKGKEYTLTNMLFDRAAQRPIVYDD